MTTRADPPSAGGVEPREHTAPEGDTAPRAEDRDLNAPIFPAEAGVVHVTFLRRATGATRCERCPAVLPVAEVPSWAEVERQDERVSNCGTISDRAARVGVRIGDHRIAPDGMEHHLVRVVRFTDEGVRVALGGHDFGLECGWDLAPEEVAAWRIAERCTVHSTHNPHPYREGTA